MDDVDLLHTDMITDSLPPLPDIPDLPDIPEHVIIVPAAPVPVTSECISFPPRHSVTTTVTGTNPQLTYVTQGNVSYRYQPHFEKASNATTITVNDPTATEAPFEPPTLMLAHSPRQTKSVPSSPNKQKTDDTVFVAPLPVTGHARPLTRITRNIPKPKPYTGQNKIIKALLAQNSTPYFNRPPAPRQRSFIVRASSRTPGVSASMPVSLANLPPGTHARPLHAQNVLLTQPPRLGSAFVITTTAAGFIPRSSSVDTVITTHVTTTTAITTPMTAAPQLTYAISPIRVVTTESTTATKTVTTSAGQSIVLISTPSPNMQSAGATQSKTYVPVQHFYKAKPEAAAPSKKIYNLVRSKALPHSPRATVVSPTSITMLGTPSLITTTAGATTSVQPPPSANTREITHNYTYLPEPGEIKLVHGIPPRAFPRTASLAQRQVSAAAAMQERAMIISKRKAARHAQHHAESQAMSSARVELGSAREVQHAASLAALQDASHAQLVAASQNARLKAQQHALLQAKIQAALEAQKATSPIATQAQALCAPLQLPVTKQLQIAALGPTQTVSLAQPHGKFNVQLLTPAQAQLLANAKAQYHATSQGKLIGIAQTQRVVCSQAQGQPLAASLPQNESLATSQLQGQLLAISNLQGQRLAASRPQNEYGTTSQLQGQPLTTSHLQGQPLATFQQPDPPLASSKPQGHHLATSQAQLLGTSQSQGPILITAQRQSQRLTKSHSQGPIMVAPQREALLATTQLQSQLLATSQAQSRATLPTQPNATLPVKSTQANATLIAQLNAPPQKIVPRGLQNFPRMQFRATSAPSKNITQAQLNAITQAQIKTSQSQQTPSPTIIQMISPPQKSAGHGLPNPRPRRRLIITTGNTAPPIDKTPITQSTTNETVAASTSLNEQLPNTSSASQQTGEVPSSSIHTTNTLTLPTGTTLIMPHYKNTVFKNLSAIGRAATTQLPTPTTTSGEIMVVRRSATYFPARRSFPTTTQSLKATTITTPKTTTTATTTPVIHIIRTVPRHMLASLQPGNARPRPGNSEVPTYIINQNKPNSEEKTEENTEEKSDEKSEEK